MATPGDGNGSSKTVLIVEDDEDISALVAMLITQIGYRVERAANGKEALAAVERRVPQLILLDMKMPVMDGWAFARAFREKHQRAAPLVVFTAAEDAAQRAAEIGADGWIGKPFDFAEFRSTLRRYLDK